MQGFFGVAMVLYIIGSVLEAVMKSQQQQRRPRQVKTEETLLTYEVEAPAESEQVSYVDSSDVYREQQVYIAPLVDELETDLTYWSDNDLDLLSDMSLETFDTDSEVEDQETQPLGELGIDTKNLTSAFRAGLIMGELIREPRSKRPWPHR